jgi:hypothetical protein
VPPRAIAAAGADDRLEPFGVQLLGQSFVGEPVLDGVDHLAGAGTA